MLLLDELRCGDILCYFVFSLLFLQWIWLTLGLRKARVREIVEKKGFSLCLPHQKFVTKHEIRNDREQKRKQNVDEVGDVNFLSTICFVLLHRSYFQRTSSPSCISLVFSSCQICLNLIHFSFFFYLFLNSTFRFGFGAAFWFTSQFMRVNSQSNVNRIFFFLLKNWMFVACT